MAVKIADCRHGRQIYFDTDVYFGPLIEKYGEYVEGEVELWKQLLREGDTVVDAGANIGTHTAALARIVGPSGSVIAFEPQLPVYYALCGTIALNELWHVSAYPYALGNKPGTTKSLDVDYNEPNSYGGVMIGDQYNGPVVPVTTLDSMSIEHVSMIKADVEGHETELLLGARETIQRCRPLLYVENDRAERSDELISTMLELGYKIYLHAPLLVRKDNYRGCTEDIFPRVASIMLLGFPEEATVTSIDLPRLRYPEDMPRVGKHALP